MGVLCICAPYQSGTLIMSNHHKNVIIWQKWADPFGEDDREDFLASLEKEDEEYSNFTDIDPSDIDKNPEKQFGIKPRNHVRVMATPMGIIPVTENTASGKIFNFWLGHTNFNITRKITSLIEETEGIETLDIFTRYRFRIAIGKAFKDAEVMQQVNENVYGYLE